MRTIESLFTLAGRGAGRRRLPAFAHRAEAGGYLANGPSARLLGLADEMFGRLVLSMPIASGGALWR
jgi:hypothetical protein